MGKRIINYIIASTGIKNKLLCKPVQESYLYSLRGPDFFLLAYFAHSEVKDDMLLLSFQQEGPITGMALSTLKVVYV